tara:strand:- start:49 stop:294 length:246 start_codon:yes stop_codon:yes gene_type:complete
MELLIKLLGLASMGAMIQEFPVYQWIVKKLDLPDKPFSCTLCFTFWLTIGPMLIIYGYIGVAYAAFSAVAAELIDRQLWNN